MKRISVQQLKATLSTAINEAESGQVLEITRHNRPVARLGPGCPPEVRYGSRVGTERLRPAIRRGSKGRYLALLLEDRGNR